MVINLLEFIPPSGNLGNSKKGLLLIPVNPKNINQKRIKITKK